MMFQKKLANVMLITAVFCCSEVKSSNSSNCSFNGISQDEDYGLSFNEVFNIALASNDDLLKQFNVSLPPKIVHKVIYQDAVMFYAKLGAKNPSRIADILARIVQNKLLGAPPKSIAHAVSESMESTLKKTGVLNKENTISLALQFVHFLNSARDSPNYDESPVSNINSVNQGILNLVEDVIPDTQNNIKVIAKTFGNIFKNLPDRVTRAPVVNDVFVVFGVDELIHL